MNGLAARPFRVLSLCAGAGGLDLGVQLAVVNARTVCFVEWDGYAAACLVARMAEESLEQAPVWDDLATFDGHPWRGAVDCVVAGWPCPPASVAGKRLGTADSRWIWPAIVRVLSDVQPGWFFGENVAGLLSVNGGLAFRDVLGDLASLGFDAEWGVFSAADVGSSQRRERLFMLAHARCERDDAAQPQYECRGSGQAVYSGGSGSTLADTIGGGHDRRAPEPRRSAVGRAAAAGAGETVGSPNSTRWQEAGSGHVEHGGHEPGCSPLADTQGVGQQGSECSGTGSWRSEGSDRNGGCALEHSHEPGQPGHVGHQGTDELPPFPPGPTEHARWERVLERRLDLAPALPEPGIRGLADGLATDVVVSRTDALRVLGNGVVPLTAAAAFTTLCQRIREVTA